MGRERNAARRSSSETSVRSGLAEVAVEARQHRGIAEVAERLERLEAQRPPLSHEVQPVDDREQRIGRLLDAVAAGQGDGRLRQLGIGIVDGPLQQVARDLRIVGQQPLDGLQAHAQVVVTGARAGCPPARSARRRAAAARSCCGPRTTARRPAARWRWARSRAPGRRAARGCGGGATCPSPRPARAGSRASPPCPARPGGAVPPPRRRPPPRANASTIAATDSEVAIRVSVSSTCARSSGGRAPSSGDPPEVFGERRPRPRGGRRRGSRGRGRRSAPAGPACRPAPRSGRAAPPRSGPCARPAPRP